MQWSRLCEVTAQSPRSCRSTAAVFRLPSVATMGTLLHLSDLHLASPSASFDVTGDYKVDSLPPHERQRRTDAISDTLHQLGSALAATETTLDAVVVSGDVTMQGRADGFALLTGILKQLGDALPPKERILVVPGNHDVAWFTKPGTRERYEAFLSLRSEGYVLPYLEGVDAETDGRLKPGAGPEPLITAPDNSFAVVGINSCDMCGVERVAESDLVDKLDEIETLANAVSPGGAAVKALREAWRRRGLDDIARVSKVQRRLCNEVAVKERERILAKTGVAPVLIAVFHHQLRPVSTVEEFKSFEGITNLGEVREWLAGNRFDILLHGHKHEQRVLEDIFVPFDGASAHQSHRLLVVSGPTIGHGQPASNPVGRLITIDSAMPRIADVELVLVPARAAGVPIDLHALPKERITVGDDSGAHVGVLAGNTASEVYSKILAAESKFDSLPRPLICRFNDGPSALQLPVGYPDVGFAADGVEEDVRAARMQQWFEDTVDWWERPVRGRAATFNHGERIRRRRGADPSQFESAIASLHANNTTTRGVMLLIDPATDFQELNSSFPAFALVQMLERNGSLTMTGYFRKQEMPHWWPINVAELAKLQRDALTELRARGTELTAGSICTITALPVAGSSAPRVVIPEVDRRVETPAALLDLVVPLYFGGQPTDVMLQRWRTVIDDWRPTDEIAADGDPVPVLGFRQLAAYAQECEALSADQRDGSDPGRRLIAELEQLHDINKHYADMQRGADRGSQHTEWRSKVDGVVTRLLTTVEEMVTASGPGS